MNEDQNLAPAQTQDIPNEPNKNNQEQISGNSREQRVKKAKKRFYSRLVAIILIFTVSIGAYSLGRRAYLETKRTFSTRNTQDEPQNVVVKEVENTNNKLNEYVDETYGIRAQYKFEDNLYTKTKDNLEYATIRIASSEIEPAPIIRPEELVKGYFVTITPLEIKYRTLENTAEIKRTELTENCPTSSSIGDIEESILDGFTTFKFRVEDCLSNRIYTYVRVGDNIFEIVQTFKGDIGFRQVYESETNLVYNSIDFLYEDPNTLDPYIEHKIRSVNFKFSYPRLMSTDCCNTPEPPIGRPIKDIIIGDSENFGAIGFYIESVDKVGNLDTYTNTLITALTDDHIIAKGTPPEGIKTEMTISGIEAVKLENYSWRENNLIVVPSSETKRYLVISYTNNIDKDILNGIIESLTVTE